MFVGDSTLLCFIKRDYRVPFVLALTVPADSDIPGTYADHPLVNIGFSIDGRNGKTHSFRQQPVKHRQFTIQIGNNNRWILVRDPPGGSVGFLRISVL